MEILLEILFEVYIELMMYVVPEEKATSHKYRIFATVIALMALVGVIALFIWGCFLIVNHDNKLGIIPVVVAIIFSIVQIYAGLVVQSRKSK